MTKELDLPEDKLAEMSMEVVKLTIEGKSQTHIQSVTGCSPAVQRKINREYSEFVRSDLWTQNRSREIVGEMDLRFGGILSRLYTALDAAELEDDHNLVVRVTKQIVDTEKARVDLLQKAGVLSAQSIGDDVAEMHARQEAILEILREVAQRWPEAGRYIADKIAEMSGEVIPTKVGNG